MKQYILISFVIKTAKGLQRKTINSGNTKDIGYLFSENKVVCFLYKSLFEVSLWYRHRGFEKGCETKPGGLDLTRSCLDLDKKSWSRQRQKVCLDSQEISVKKSWSRSRFLDFVSASISRPWSLDRDWEFHRDQKILAFLDSLSWSRSRVSQFFQISRSRFLNLSRFAGVMYLKKSLKCWDFSTNFAASWQILLVLDKSRQSRFISTISIKISTQKSRF